MLNHLAIIMDWNRRRAKSRFLPSLAWHRAWVNNVKDITNLCEKKNIKYLTLWALSTDNLNKRWKKEVENIIKLINSIEKYLWEMLEKKVRLNIIWDIEKLPETSRQILSRVVEKTKDNSSIFLTIALIYGWQDEILRATKKIIASWLDPDKLSRENFRKYLDTNFLPVPDVIVRTGWDFRHSWFLLFDSEYSEYYFTQKKWPEFDEEELDKVIDYFEKCKRNFWK